MLVESSRGGGWGAPPIFQNVKEMKGKERRAKRYVSKFVCLCMLGIPPRLSSPGKQSTSVPENFPRNSGDLSDLQLYPELVDKISLHRR